MNYGSTSPNGFVPDPKEDTDKEQPIRTPDDNWNHVNGRNKCGGCMWFAHKPGMQGFSPSGELGRCRRHAPTMAGFPVVWTTDWCGDHKIDETKY